MVERVKHMEKCMEMVQAALRKGEMHTVRRQIRTLRTYMESGQWLADYEADEDGNKDKSNVHNRAISRNSVLAGEAKELEIIENPCGE